MDSHNLVSCLTGILPFLAAEGHIKQLPLHTQMKHTSGKSPNFFYLTQHAIGLCGA